MEYSFIFQLKIPISIEIPVLLEHHLLSIDALRCLDGALKPGSPNTDICNNLFIILIIVITITIADIFINIITLAKKSKHISDGHLYGICRHLVKISPLRSC